MKTYCISIIILFIIGCRNKIKPSVEDMKIADRQFSPYSNENGYAQAFVEFAHPDAVMIR
jgi:hypothetical protein